MVLLEERLASGSLNSFRTDSPVELGSMVASHGIGAYLYTKDGRRFLDYWMGMNTLMLGHAHPSIVKAVIEQAQRGSNLQLLYDDIIELAKIFCEAVPCADKVQFVCSGTEATMLALRLARAYSGKNKVLKFDGAFHGWHDFLLMSTNYRGSEFYAQKDWDEKSPITPDFPGIPASLADMVITAPYNDADTTCNVIEEHKDELAAVFVECMSRSLPSKPGFLEAIRKVTRQLGILLVFDEVVTGFRFAYGGAQEYYGVTADLATYGKGMSGGYPIGAVAGRKEIMNLLNPETKDQRRTFYLGSNACNAVVVAASLACLKELGKPGTYESLNGYGNKLKSGMAELFGKYGLDAQMAGVGSITDYFFMKEEISDYRSVMKSNLKLKRELARQLMLRNILPGGRWANSTCHGEKELQMTLSAMDDALKALRSVGKSK